MSTIANNSYQIAANTDQWLPNASGNSINQGDICYVDVNHQVNSVGTTGATNTNSFVGIANDTYPVPNQYSNQPVLPFGIITIGRVQLKANSGDTFQPYLAVWPASADAQTVTVTSGNAFPIGYVANLPDNSQRGLVGTGTNYIQIDIRAAVNI